MMVILRCTCTESSKLQNIKKKKNKKKIELFQLSFIVTLDRKVISINKFLL